MLTAMRDRAAGRIGIAVLVAVVAVVVLTFGRLIVIRY
jgi:hypothetical protein